ncbi:Metalloendopeptidase, glycoprotease family [Elusimicrobium minutum Pei191]|uniref:tRNA N6-adenosine threonylcarbamoyltransferase n=1 Tax=Elusimicrobium minutum (strain Pei191) TaxID=445932 RepID=B2KE20_ELUMP|nr:tRNA (adenosine(37)-N6)-threonylcarbamoyltransferase complex transferase subunit TsaD [Elusimicrobium minutum]ACC98766.1 Metalloendopeptidase, glycoprotease family [Elusimicrobium minutum Pei191]
MKTDKDITILGIETTCDETSAAILKSGRDLVSNVVHTQIDIHKKYCGVVPELASRAHAVKVAEVVKEALGNHKIDLVAFASGPGLPGGLMVGRVAAEAVSALKNVPIIGVNHLEGHLFACEFDAKEGKIAADKQLKFPLIALIVSGGHTELWYVKNYGDYKMLGRTRDDAAGEAFDKVAKLLGLGYPGGPVVAKEALKGNPEAIKFPRPMMKGTFEFSFSGIKTAVSYYLRDHKDIKKEDVCASFQAAMVETLVAKTFQAVKKYKVKNVAVGGGVAANELLKESMVKRGQKEGVDVSFVPRALSSDNGAMIALAGYKKFMFAGKFNANIRINPNMRIKNWGK